MSCGVNKTLLNFQKEKKKLFPNPFYFTFCCFTFLWWCKSDSVFVLFPWKLMNIYLVLLIWKKKSGAKFIKVFMPIRQSQVPLSNESSYWIRYPQNQIFNFIVMSPCERPLLRFISFVYFQFQISIYSSKNQQLWTLEQLFWQDKGANEILCWLKWQELSIILENKFS